MKNWVNELYTGHDSRSIRFRYALILFDLATITYFIVTTPMLNTPMIKSINAALALIILLDFVARFWIAEDKREHASRIYVVADFLVIISLVLNRFVAVDLSFLRILRGLRLGHSHHLLQDLRRSSSFFRRREDAIVASVNMIVFVFVTASAIFSFFAREVTGVEAYVDALYFTVTTFTTTGFGDITPTTMMQKLFSIGVMVIGVSLFVQLARSIVMPPKVRYSCPDCGLSRHDSDAVHCKHCGRVVHIKTEGAN